MASTKAFTTQVTVLTLIALWFKEHRDLKLGKGASVEAIRLKESLMRLPITFGMALKSRDQCKAIAKRLEHKEHCFVLGKGGSYSSSCLSTSLSKMLSNFLLLFCLFVHRIRGTRRP